MVHARVSHMLKAIHAQESREATEVNAKAVIQDLGAGKMGRSQPKRVILGFRAPRRHGEKFRTLRRPIDTRWAIHLWASKYQSVKNSNSERRLVKESQHWR